MLEKIGLPPKPALKGNEWVLDASHCQTCSSAFTFFNRKHHCRRCGGIFCGSCTQQRIYLRGQGDGQVRVCNACKIQEDAARLEMRHGHRNKATKHLAAVAGKPKAHSNVETDLILKELLDHEANAEISSKKDLIQEVNELVGSSSSPFTSSGNSTVLGVTNSDVSQSSAATPEMLLLQAQELKRQWLTLKKDGKGEAALQAFKQAKEMERQAESLKLAMRRNTRKASVSVAQKDKLDDMKMDKKSKVSAQTVPISRTNDEMHPIKANQPARKKSEYKDDIIDDLKDIGWSDADLQEGNKTNPKTVEGELAELVSTMHNDEGKNRPKLTSSMEVLAHKRRALALKREGNLAEAKEELKKAKLLERQLEEQQMFDVEEDESDDELSALMRSLEKQEMMGTTGIMDLDISAFSNINNLDFTDDDAEGMEVTDMDINDPEMLAALRLMGWEEDMLMKMDANISPYSQGAKGADRNSEFSKGQKFDDFNDSYYLSALVGFEEKSSEVMHPVMASIQKPSDKESLQQQISFLKKEAVALKRAGKVREAKEEFHRAKQLEKDLKDSLSEEDVMSSFSVDNAAPVAQIGVRSHESLHVHEDFDVDDVAVTEEDMGDPELAKALQSLGWQDDETETPAHTLVVNATHRSKTKPQLQKELLGIKRAALKLRREGKIDEAEEQLQKAQEIEDLLQKLSTDPPKNNYEKQMSSSVESPIGNLKLEEKLSSENDGDAHLQVPVGESLISPNTDIASPFSSSTVTSHSLDNLENQTDDNHKNSHHERAAEVDLIGFLDSGEGRKGKEDSSTSLISFSQDESINVMEPATKQIPTRREPTVHVETPKDQVLNVQHSEQNIQQEILTLKRKALALKREGKQAEAKEQLREAKVLEKKLEQSQANLPTIGFGKQESELTKPLSKHVGVASSVESHTSGSSLVQPSHFNADKHVVSKDRKKLQQMSLAHKRKALALRREGKMEDADAEFELAKSIERQMEELESSGENRSQIGLSLSGDADGVDDIFDLQLFAALKGLGWNDSDILQAAPRVEDEIKDKKATGNNPGVVSQAEKNRRREELEEQIKTEKLRALQLKRAGRQSEALDTLRGAKQLEKKLQSLI